VTFVIDTSGSMSGDKLDRAKQAVNFCLEHLGSDDLFNIIRFSSDVDLLSDAPLSASSSNVERAKEFVQGMRALGGTAISDALARALEQPDEEGVPHIIVFLTDGMPTVGQTDTDRIVRDVKDGNGHRARIFGFGLGEDVNANFLDAISQENRGSSEYARGGEELEQKLSSFYEKIAFPVMADLVVKVDGDSEIYDVFPRELPDLFHGGQLLLIGRYRDDGDADVVLGGKVGAQTKTFSYEVNFPDRESDNDFLAHMWATRKVGYLLDNIRLNGEDAELRDEVITLGRRYGIVTPYTSYLVTEDTAVPNRMGWNQQIPVEEQAWRAPMGGMFVDEAGAGSYGGNGGPTTVAMPSPAAPPSPDYERYHALSALPQAAGSTSGEAASGVAGRRMSEELRDMREADRVESGAATRFVAGRLFIQQSGAWVEDGAADAGATMEIKYLSGAYFALLTARPELREVLTLGENVTFKTADGKAIVIRSGSGRESVSSGDLEAMFED